MLTHGNLTSNALVLTDYWGFSASDRLLHALPIFHTHGLFVACNVILLAGASMILMPRFDLDELLRLLPQANTLMGVPTFYTRLLTCDEVNHESMQHMRLFISGSAPLTAETHKAFAERTGHAILERYGMTETGMNTSNPYAGERIAGTVGFPLPGVDIRITDPDGKELRELVNSDVGMIEVRGPNVFKGYWRMPEKTGEELRDDGFFITGDLGFIDERGYVHIVGRGKDLIISGGFNVYPKEIEMLLDQLPGVAESAVVGVPHPDFGEGVVAVVVAAAGAELDEPHVLQALAGRLAKYKTPKRVFVVDNLPRNVMGKVQKNELRAQYKDACEG
jgi:malonyl-CoA/methylmalonyl-CoA synthetase